MHCLYLIGEKRSGEIGRWEVENKESILCSSAPYSLVATFRHKSWIEFRAALYSIS